MELEERGGERVSLGGGGGEKGALEKEERKMREDIGGGGGGGKGELSTDGNVDSIRRQFFFSKSERFFPRTHFL